MLLFTVLWIPKHISRNVPGFIGQYCHGNQPDHKTPLSYHFINKPEKSQVVVDNILNNFQGVGKHGLALCGLDDAGECHPGMFLALWDYILFSPANDKYIVTVPLFDKVE